MNTRRALGVGVLLAAAVLGQERRAAACGACLCDDQPRAIINLIRGLPLNLQVPLRVWTEGEAAPWLERADGMKVAATVELLETPARVWWLQVDEDLEPNTDYFITREQGREQGFTTGLARDEQAPTLDAMRAAAGGNEGLCGSAAGGRITFSGANDEGETFNAWLEVELDIDGTPHTAFTDYPSGPLPIGTSDGVSLPGNCFGPMEFPGLAPDTDYPLRARLHDAAGNVSAWATTVLTAQASEPGSCAPTGTAGSSATDPNPGSDAHSERTSKGCGCSVPVSQPGWPAEGLLTSLLLLGLAARRK